MNKKRLFRSFQPDCRQPGTSVAAGLIGAVAAVGLAYFLLATDTGYMVRKKVRRADRAVKSAIGKDADADDIDMTDDEDD